MANPCDYYFKGRKLTYDQFRKELKGLPMSEIIEMFPSIKEEGISKIAWTTGEQQNERYDLSKQVQSISYEKKSKEFSSKAQEKGQDLYSLYIETKESGYEQFDDLTISEVEGYVGKDIANKIQNNEGNKENLDTSKGNKKVNKLTGLDLKVGGKGMKGFYGSPKEGSLGIVGNVAKSLFKQEPKTVEIEVGNSQVDLDTPPRVIKLKSGEYVVQTPFNDSYVMVDGEMENPTFKDLSSAKEFYINETNRYNKEIEKTKTSTQHSIDITPEMRADVEQGMTLFQKGVKMIPNGFIKGDKVYLNSDSMSKSTPIHEFGHLYHKWLKQTRPEVYARGLELIQAEIDKGENSAISNIIDSVKLTQPNLIGEAFKEEVLTELVGKEGLKLIEETKGKVEKGSIQEWLSNVWKEIKQMLGLSSMTNEEIMNLTLGEYARAVNVDLLSGEKIKDETPPNYTSPPDCI